MGRIQWSIGWISGNLFLYSCWSLCSFFYVIFFFRIPPNQYLPIILVQSNRRSWTTKTDGSRAWRKSRASAQKGNYIYHRIFLIGSVLFSIYEMIDYHKWWSILGRFLTSLLMSLIPLLIDSAVDPFFNSPIL